MAAKLTRLTHKIGIQLHLVVESCTICSFFSRRPVRKLMGTPSYIYVHIGPVKFLLFMKFTRNFIDFLKKVVSY